MKNIKKNLLITVLFFSLATVFANPLMPLPPPVPPHSENQPFHKNFHGKRMFDDKGKFFPVFIRVFECENGVIFESYFTQPIDANSINSESILINDIPIDVKQIRFSKTSRGMRFVIPQLVLGNQTNEVSILIRDIKSFNGNIMEPVELKTFHINSEYRYMEKVL